MKSRRWIRPIIFGFLAMYLVTMLLATYMVKQKFTEEYQQNMLNVLSNVQRIMSDKEEAERGSEAYTDALRSSYSGYLLSGTLTSGSSGAYQMFSGAVYKGDGTLLARTDNLIGGMMSIDESNGKSQYRYFSLDVLSKEELEELASYYEANLTGMIPDAAKKTLDEYRISIKVSTDKTQLYGIFVQKITWTNREYDNGEYYSDPLTNASYSWDAGDVRYRETDSELVWEWNAAGTEDLPADTFIIQNANTLFPYLNTSRTYWETWNQSVYLHDFPLDKGPIDYADALANLNEKMLAMAEDTYSFGQQETFQTMVMQGDPYGKYEYYYLEIRSECHPWLASMDYLRYIYLAGLALMLVCMIKIIYVTNKTYEQRAALDETRRDFTNAMAHELKTPLGIIRGFAENLKERTMEEKRDYYLDHIIGQTEEMDRLVAQMIEVSKLDSEKLILQQDQVSLMELCKGQMKRLEPVVQEKKLHVEYREEDVCLVTGDSAYLEKAVWNLLDNAVAYNLPDGWIHITCQKDQCIIENAGFPMDEEQLAHAFDLMYSSDKSRGGRGHHLGMGLYLAKKILDRHGIDLKLENGKDGVRVILKIGNRPSIS